MEQEQETLLQEKLKEVEDKIDVGNRPTPFERAVLDWVKVATERIETNTIMINSVNKIAKQASLNSVGLGVLGEGL